jgi:hypothetical protein
MAWLDRENTLSFPYQGSISTTCLCATFTCADHKSSKRQSSYQCHFALLGSASIKAVWKMLVKLTSDPSWHTKQKQKHASKYQRNSGVSFCKPLITPHVYVRMIYFSKYDCNYKRQTQILTYFTYIHFTFYYEIDRKLNGDSWMTSNLRGLIKIFFRCCGVGIRYLSLITLNDFELLLLKARERRKNLY